MNQNSKYPDWFFWLWEKGALLLLGAGFLVLGCLACVIFYFDTRLEQIEDKIQYVPPRTYQKPDLDEMTVGDFDVGTLPRRQVIYVPVYSHVYYQGGSPYSLETTLSIRNIDPNDVLYVTSVEYFDTSGELVKTYLKQAIKLSPLQTIEFLVERRDSSGGSGANFLVEWRGENASQALLVEAVMVGTGGTQGISMARRGMVIEESSLSKE